MINIPSSIPDGYRIRFFLERDASRNHELKYVVEKRFLGFWMRVTKPVLNVLTHSKCKAPYKDHTGRGYDIVVSDGACRTYEEAFEFLHYKPFETYMTNGTHDCVELWANNAVARNFINAGMPYKEHRISRVGLFLSIPGKNTYFECKEEFWEQHFSEHYRLEKVL